MSPLRSTRPVSLTLVRGHIDGASLERGRLDIAPYDPVTPAAAKRLDHAIDVLMPRIRITDLLWGVNAQTGFLDALTDLRSGRLNSNPVALLATILAGATNLGPERMAQASRSVSHAQLSWASTWYLRSRTYADELARIINAHHALPFARIWGSADRTSSDGQFFPSGRKSGAINAKYGPDPGLKIYSFLSGQYGSFHANVMGAAVGKAPFVLDGLAGNAAQFNPLVHHVDTGGVSDQVFALFHLGPVAGKCRMTVRLAHWLLRFSATGPIKHADSGPNGMHGACPIGQNSPCFHKRLVMPCLSTAPARVQSAA